MPSGHSCCVGRTGGRALRVSRAISGSPRGADASCAIYSLIETAKHNGLEPYAHLYYLFSKAPIIQEAGGWDDLLPGGLDAETLKAFYLADIR